jgi:hypothetical protein
MTAPHHLNSTGPLTLKAYRDQTIKLYITVQHNHASMPELTQNRQATIQAS